MNVEGVNWTLLQAGRDGLPFYIRVRELPGNFDRDRYEELVRVIWEYDAVQNGLPGLAEKDRMDEFEDILLSTIEPAGYAIIAIAITGDGQRAHYLYSRSSDETMRLVNAALSGLGRLPIEFRSDPDPDWKMYARFSIPVSS